MREDTLEIATFLARCWSGSPQMRVSAGAKYHTKNVMRVIPPEDLVGTALERYRQMRANVWLASMVHRLGGKDMSDDHAFGFVYNVLRVRTAELAGLREWRGMTREVVFNYAFQWMYRPLLNAVYGKPRIAEAFLQYFLFCDIKGDITQKQLDNTHRACKTAQDAIDAALSGGIDALERAVPVILEELELDSLSGIRIAFPWARPDIAVNPDELNRAIERAESAAGMRKGASDAQRPDESIVSEFETIGMKHDTRQVVHDGITVPPITDVDEGTIYDYELIARLKNRFRDWKTRWAETLDSTGAELDVESYIESRSARRAFVQDERRESSADIMMLLDHSSSIASVQTQYKKAALALCEVLAKFSARFSVYAFSTAAKSVVCWEVKHSSQRWDATCAKRLAQIAANGTTPLAQVYHMMSHVLDADRPETLLTMTDGEPSDAAAVREFVRAPRAGRTRMVALGMGADVVRATAIAENLKGLGYERVLAVSRLADIPGKVLDILDSSAKR